MIKSSLAAIACSILGLSGAASLADWPKQRSVEIHKSARSDLCTAAEKAVVELRQAPGQLYGKFRDPSTRATTELQLGDLTFYALQTKTFTTVDGKSEQRTFPVDYYLVDIDNRAPQEMISFVSGGHGPAGEGDTLTLLDTDLSSAPQPLAHEKFLNGALEIGPLTLSFRGQDFDAGYYIYPFKFQGRNYLLIDGNGDQYRKTLVAELIPGTGLVTRCYF